VLAGSASAAILQVPQDFPTIQAAIDVAHDDDVVQLAKGVHRESQIRFDGKRITLRSANPASPAVVSDTVIDGGMDHTVFRFQANEGLGSVIDGITITKGSSLQGGAIDIKDASPLIRRCVFDNNLGRELGGAIYMENSYARLEYCRFVNNTADKRGGALFISASSPLVANCEFLWNSAEKDGGAIEVQGNSAPHLIASQLAFNRAGDHGGAIDTQDVTRISLDNCLLVANEAGSTGGAVHARDFTVFVARNCTVIDNTAGNRGGGLAAHKDGDPTLHGCILWANTPSALFGSPWKVWSSNVEGGWEGDGGNNIDTDPLLTNHREFNYILSADSPSIDAGAAESYDGIVWPNGYENTGVADQGAYGGPGGGFWLR
jgi:predicted outer membrane repeat protein